jgi:threonine dehydratase
MGSGKVLDEMWPLVRHLLAGSVVVSLRQIADAIRLLVQRVHVVAEGAGAAGLAAFFAIEPSEPTVCVISGGNIDELKLVRILHGDIP